jgi:hypothetical protein
MKPSLRRALVVIALTANALNLRPCARGRDPIPDIALTSAEASKTISLSALPYRPQAPLRESLVSAPSPSRRR